MSQEPLPEHIAIVMDGNGRWARKRGWERIRGHRAGVQAVRDTATACARRGVRQLTLYAFSTENWKRPKREVDLLFKLLRDFLVDERGTIMDNAIRLTSVGEIEGLPDHVLEAYETTRAMSADNDGMVLCLALNYGSRRELTLAAQQLAGRVAAGELAPEALSEQLLDEAVAARGAGDVDLLIRTGGEQRLSNFLLWQASYAELYYTDVYWPDFREPDLALALEAFAARERRFGDVGAGPRA